MAKININFNDKSYSIDEASLSASTDALKSHLSTVMNGSGATINLGGTSYNVDSTKLSAATNAFVSHLGTIAGESGGSDTLYWDGNTEGLVVVEYPDAGFSFVKISDNVITEEDLRNGITVKSTYEETMTFSYDEIKDGMSGGGLVAAEGYFALSPYDNYSFMDYYTFPEAGVYAFWDGEGGFESLTIPNYTGFGGGSGSKVTVNGVEYSIDPTKVAGAVAELETVLGGLNSGDAGGCDTLYWDGNTEGLVCVDTGDSQYYLVADNVITADDLKGGFTTVDTYGDSYTVEYSEELEEVLTRFGGAVPMHEAFGFLIPTDNFVFMDMFTFPKAGIYFGGDEYGNLISLTIPGYTGFEHSENCGH